MYQIKFVACNDPRLLICLEQILISKAHLVSESLPYHCVVKISGCTELEKLLTLDVLLHTSHSFWIEKYPSVVCSGWAGSASDRNRKPKPYLKAIWNVTVSGSFCSISILVLVTIKQASFGSQIKMTFQPFNEIRILPCFRH